MSNSFSHPCCAAIDLLAAVRDSAIVGMFVEVEIKVLFIEAWTNMIVDSVIGVVTDKLADVFVDVCADMRIVVATSCVDIIVVAATVVALEFNTVPLSCVVNVLAGMVVGALFNALTDSLTEPIICDVSRIGVDALAEVNMNVWTALVALKIVMPIPSENPLLID